MWPSSSRTHRADHQHGGLRDPLLRSDVSPETIAAARALGPIHERQVFGRGILMFDSVDRAKLAPLGDVAPQHRRPVRRRESAARAPRRKEPPHDRFHRRRRPAAAAPAPARATRPFYWSVRRELLGEPFALHGPADRRAVVLFGFTLSALHPRNFHFGAMALDPAKRDALAVLPYYIGAMVIIVTGVIVGAFYCLGALHNERRDRSILFWKSLPVSDLVPWLQGLRPARHPAGSRLRGRRCPAADHAGLNCAGLLLHGVVDTRRPRFPCSISGAYSSTASSPWPCGTRRSGLAAADLRLCAARAFLWAVLPPWRSASSKAWPSAHRTFPT